MTLYDLGVAVDQVRLSSNGQVSVPARVRKRWGTRDLIVIDKGDRIIVRPVPADPYAAAAARYGQSSLTSDDLRRSSRDEDAAAEDRRR